MTFNAMTSKKNLLSLIPLALPITIVVLVVLGVTYVIFGQFSISAKHQRTPSAKYSQRIVETQLSIAGYRKSLNTQTILISLDTSDLDLITTESTRKSQNATAEEYKKLLSFLSEHNPYQVVVNWNPLRELEPQQINEFNEVFRRSPGKFSLYTNSINYKSALNNFSKYARVKLNDVCAGDQFSICPYVPDWQFWSVVDLLHQFSDKEPKSFLSKNLNLEFDAFLLRLDDPNSQPEYTFSDLLLDGQQDKKKWESILEDKIIFIGNNLIQGAEGSTHPDNTGRVGTPYIDPETDSRLNGTPIHAFWAQLTRMFIDNDFVYVASKNLINIVSIFLGSITLTSALLFGPFVSLVVFLISSVVLFFSNVILIREFSFHMPIFDSLYLAGNLYIIGGFLRLTIEGIREKYNIQKEKTMSENIDLKSNFISLISHNLNTPVAKMISLLELSKKSIPEDLRDQYLKPCLEKASKIQLSVRSVLASNKLEDKRLSHDIVTSAKLIEEIEFETIPMLNRIGISLNVEDESPLQTARFSFDRRLFIPIISSVTYLLSDTRANQSKSFFLTLMYDDADQILKLEWNTSNLKPIILNRKILDDFTVNSCWSLHDSFLKNHEAKIEVEQVQPEQGYNLTLSITV